MESVAADRQLDAGTMDCGSGLLLLLTRTIRQLEPGQTLTVRTEEPSVPPDLTDWARLAGHAIATSRAEAPTGPWHVTIRPGRPAGSTVFSAGGGTALGQRLWLYSNFHCNLACGYCCAGSSPQAAARLLPVELARSAAREFAGLGGRDLLVTGGEPFLHPDIGPMIEQLAAELPVTVLTNAMLFDRGARLAALQSWDRNRVTLQVSLDSAEAALHDRNRGPRSHARALAGIVRARELGFTVRIAATLYEDQTAAAAGLDGLLDTLDIAPRDRLIRPVAQQGAADTGEQLTVDMLEPEPTLTVDGIWWHPVAVTDPAFQVAAEPLPLAAALDTIRDTVAVQDAARREGRRHVFRCA